eukprot:TRINITY_DN3952_c3_g2_i1.p2 TRINITY_DN3952_c3_g2~~TRINITY_DN3952_c3_g2_i1.p2  ORF type:complete len:398 (+),score=141.11 TRINITY_DN3952_c3_g2_i1:111-1304(+)
MAVKWHLPDPTLAGSGLSSSSPPQSPLEGQKAREVAIPVAEDRGGTTFYAVDVRRLRPGCSGGPQTHQWRVWHRYSDFVELRQLLAAVDAADGLPAFPGRTLLKLTGASAAKVERRRRDLAAWLAAAVGRAGSVSPESLRSFLQSDPQYRADGTAVGCVRVQALDCTGRPLSVSRIRLLSECGPGAAGDELPPSRAGQCDCSSSSVQQSVGQEPPAAPRWLLGRQPPMRNAWSAGRAQPGEWVRLRLVGPRHVSRIVVDGVGGARKLRIDVWPDTAALGPPAVREEVMVRCVSGDTPSGRAFAELSLSGGRRRQDSSPEPISIPRHDSRLSRRIESFRSTPSRSPGVMREEPEPLPVRRESTRSLPHQQPRSFLEGDPLPQRSRSWRSRSSSGPWPA